MAEPSVRARHLRNALAAAGSLPGAAALRAAIPARVLAEVEAATGFDWLPVEHDVAIVRASAAVLPPEQFERLWRGVVLEGVEGPLLGLLMRTAVRMFGLDPAGFAGWIPKAWVMVFRDVGRWEVGPPSPGTVSLRLEGLPAACRDPVFARSVACSLGAVPVLAGRSGGARVVERGEDGAAVTFEVIWGAAREAAGA